MNTFIKFTLNEITKLAKNKINYFYLIIVSIAVVIPIFGIKILENNSTTGYSYLLLSLQSLNNTILPFLLLIFTSTMISSEIRSGTIRNILVSNPSRIYFLSSKIFTCLIFQFVLLTVATIISTIIGYFLFGFGNIVEDGFIILNQYQFWATFSFSFVLLFVILSAVSLFGLFISTISWNNISAVTISIGSYILLEIIKIKMHIGNFIFSTYIEFPLNMLSELTQGFHPSWTPKLYNCLIVSFSWIFGLLSLSLFIISKRDFK